MTPAETELIATIKTRGYWRVVIRPSRFVDERVGRAELANLVSRCSVDLRGWDFPHINTTQQAHIDADWAGQTDEWEHNLELWRLYRSGQFVSITGLPYDWRDRSGFWPPHDGWAHGTHLSVNHVIARFTEIADFAARLSQTPAGDEQLVLTTELHGMRDRLLMWESARRLPMRPFYRAGVPAIVVTRSVPRADLIARGRELALLQAEELFTYFGWTPGTQVLTDFQREVVGGR